MRLNKKMGLLTYASLVLALASPVSSTVMAANSTSTKISSSKKVTTNNQATAKQNSIVGQSSETPIDISTGWNIAEYTSDVQPDVNKVLQQNHITVSNQKGVMVQEGNAGNSTLTAQKVIPMKKGHSYNLDLIYAQAYTTGNTPSEQSTGYIDFNGDRIDANNSDDSDKHYIKTITPTADMNYTITIHYTTVYPDNAYVKLGYDMNGNGITDKSGMVTSKYVDEQGNKVADDEVQTGKFGDSYTTSQKDIAGYTFKEVQGNPSGVFEDKEQTVTYVYTKSVDKSSIDGSDVTKHVGDKLPADSEFKATATDKDGNSVGVTIDKSKVDMTKAGDYDVVITADDGQTKTVQVHVLTNQQSIKGSDVTKHVGDAIPGDSEFKASATGKDGKDISVTLDKSKVDMSKAGDYDVVITADDGQTKTVQVHVLDRDQAPKDATVIVDYVDQDGNTIAKSDVLTGYAGDKYTTKAKNIDGYELVSAPKNKEGIFVKGTTKVVYSYQKVKDEDPTTPATPNKPEAPKGDSKTKTVTVQKKKLPQTGEAILAESIFSVIGLLALVSALYVVIKRRVNKSKNV